MKREDEICECSHIRLWHVNNKGSCVHQKGWKANFAFCKCKKFKKRK